MARPAVLLQSELTEHADAVRARSERIGADLACNWAFGLPYRPNSITNLDNQLN